MEILIIQTAFPGDLYLSLPLLKQTRRFFPTARIHLMCRQGMGRVFSEEGLVDQVLEIKKGDRRSYAEALKTLKTAGIDWVISPHRSYRTALWVRKLKPQNAVGYKLWWNSLFFNLRLSYPRELPDALRQLKLLTLVSEDFKKEWESFPFTEDLRGSKDEPVANFEDIQLPPWMSGQIKKWMPEGKVICIAPGSVWPTKRWPTSFFSDLTARLLGEGFQVKIIGTAADQTECDQVATENPKAENLCGKTSLSELLSLFQKSLALVSNDSGAMHVAAATGLPTVAIFGPTVPEFGFRPWQSRSRIVQAPLNCRPCSIHGTKKCPLGTHDCMKLVSADQVHEQLLALISQP